MPPPLSPPAEARPSGPFRVLSLDGGGVRGVCTAAYLAHVEAAVGEPLYRFFDLICGTSTGGLIALALAQGTPASEILELYRERSAALFSRRHPRLPRKAAMFAGSLYESAPLHAELRRVLGDDVRIGASKTRVCVPAVNISTGKVVVFKTRHHARLHRDHLLPAWKVAAATSAAPVFFDPFRIDGVGLLVDGGLWANTPATVGIIEALDQGYTLGDVELLSIGTGAAGFHRAGAGGTRRARYGLAWWGAGLVDLSMHAQTDRAENDMHLLLGERHTRIQFALPDGTFELDDVSRVGLLADLASEQERRSGHAVRERFFADTVTPFIPLP